MNFEDQGEPTATSLPPTLATWLRRWAATVREVDFAEARQLFTDDVIGFGTRNQRLDGLGELEDRQWRLVWPHSVGFDFDLATAHAEVSDDGTLATVIVQWSSTGFRGEEPFNRPGRATIVLRRTPSGWRAAHTHVSMDPGADAETWRTEPRAEPS